MDLGVLMFDLQSRSDDRAAVLLEEMAADDPLLRGQHLAAAVRFRRRADLCRALLAGQAAGTDPHPRSHRP